MILQNQTKPEWLISGQNTLGTGLFLIPDIDKGEPEQFVKRMVKELSYERCVSIGRYVLAFKWIPERVAKSDQIVLEPCSDECVLVCERLSCFCVDGICR